MIKTKLDVPSEIYNSSLHTINGVKFSQREIDVIACVMQMRTGKKIASQLSIAARTIESHIRNITQKIECSSREGIVDFIEKSDKYLEIKRYYSYLLILMAFEEQLLSLSKKISTQVPRYNLVYDQKDANNAMLPLIRKHLCLVGLKELPVEITCKYDAAKSINALQIAQETDNYYLNFFNLLFKLFPDIDSTFNVSEFEKQCNRLLDPHTSPNQKEGRSIDPGETTNREKPKWGLISLIGTVGLLFVCAIAFLLMPPNADPVIRSSLSIPMDAALLTRAKLLREIDKKLSDQKGIQNIALIGIGGSGKTTLARQYAGSKRTLITWELNAQNRESLKASFESLAHALSKSEDDSKTLQDIQEIRDLKKKEEKIIAFVKEKFRSQSPWVLIFDNVERFTDIQSFFPSDQVSWGKGRVILTTQDHHIQQNNQVKASLIIGELTNQEKKDLFAKIIGLETNQTHTKEKTKENANFFENLPPFPLDITVAAHYIKATQIPNEDYLHNLSKNDSPFLKTQEQLLKETTDYNNTRYQIITTSLRHLIETNKDFAGLLLFVCLMDSHDIPRELLNYVDDSTVVDSFIYHLKKYSLITSDSSSPDQGSSFSLHKSMQEISLAYLTKVRDQAENQDAMKHILEALEEHFEQVINNEDFSKMDQLINHLRQFLQHKALLNPTANGVVESELGCIYYYLGYYESALQLLNKSFINLKSDSENNQLRIARVLSHIGKVHRETGDFQKAIEYFRDSISIYEHYSNAILELARTLGYLGYTYRNFSDFDNAKYFLKKALTIYKNHSESPVWTAWTLAHLGIIDREVGTYEDAKTRLEESLVIFKQVKNQKRISWVLGNLGRVYDELGYYDIAQKLLEEGLETHLKYFSENHSNVTWLLTNLGDVYCKLGKYQLAKNTHEKSLAIRNKLFGEDNIKTLGVYGHLGDTYSSLGDFQKAIKCIEITRVAYEKHYGSNHLKTARVYRVLGNAYLIGGELEKAEGLTLKSLEIFNDKKHLGAYILFEDLAEINLIKSKQALKAGDSGSARNFSQKSHDNLKYALEIIQANFPKDSPHLKRIQEKIRTNI